jgi:hypothetical protein
MRRFLVLTDESARHPFLASLPPHVRRVDPGPPDRTWLLAWPVSGEDVRQFLMAYCACLLAALTFIW